MLTQETTAPTARRRTRDPEGTRALLVTNAFHEIHAHGYAGASLDRILTKSGVTKGALYHHFKSKADLLHAVIDEAIQPMVTERWLGPLHESDNPIRTLTETTGRMMAEATPEEMAEIEHSYTGQYLKHTLAASRPEPAAAIPPRTCLSRPEVSTSGHSANRVAIRRGLLGKLDHTSLAPRVR